MECRTLRWNSRYALLVDQSLWTESETGESQIRDLKRRYPGTILMFEVGYKMIFYGEDARVASKELGVVCFPKRNFLNAWVPPHRKHIYLRK